VESKRALPPDIRKRLIKLLVKQRKDKPEMFINQQLKLAAAQLQNKSF